MNISINFNTTGEMISKTDAEELHRQVRISLYFALKNARLWLKGKNINYPIFKALEQAHDMNREHKENVFSGSSEAWCLHKFHVEMHRIKDIRDALIEELNPLDLPHLRKSA